MSIALIYSSLTGNTQSVALQIKENVPEVKAFSSVDDINFKYDDYDTYIICYWNDKGTADSKTIESIKNLSNKKVIAVGTLGAYPDGEHAEKMKNNVRELIESSGNTLIGEFCCQGKIDEKMTEQFRSFPEGHPHYLDDERLARHLESRKHPNQEDFNNAIEAVRNAIKG